jgi:tetratricopeptide (TPR) repeat protein
MTTKKILLFSFILMHFNAFSQRYNVSVDDRNTTIDLTNQAIQNIKENKLPDAISLLTKAISIDSTFRPSYLNLYQAFMLNKDNPTTIIFYLKKAKRIFSEDDEISFYTGEVYRKNNDIKNAFKEYKVAIKYSKKNGEDFPLVSSYYFNRGNCYLKMNQIDSALLDYNYTLKLKPDYSLALLNRGVCLFKKGKSSEACVDWKKSLELGCSAAKEYLEKYCKENN